MKNYKIDKRIGETTTECISRIRLLYPEIRDSKLGHLGTLDPMASGLMVFLADADTKKVSQFQKLSKTYTVKIIFGISTDSYDILGIPTSSPTIRDILVDKKVLDKTISTFKGKIEQCPPPYSAIIINGKPLYWWYRNNRQNEIEIKPRQREIYSINIGKIYNLDLDKIRQTLLIINNLKGNFRQVEIISAWRNLISNLSKENINRLSALDLTISCSSGTYIRSIVYNIGQKLDIPTMAFNIRRIAIGDIS